MRIALLLMLFPVLMASCQPAQQIAVDNIEEPPVFTAADTVYANVFKPLDGRWEGVFKIYRDTVRGTREDSLLHGISLSRLQAMPLRFTDSILVVQEYRSESPYFQRVEIRDTYPESGKTVKSRGVNKVQEGQLWCVVKKPEETVVHKGSLEGAHTIIWQRDERNPQKVEYFRETVEKNTYEIVGWGYYQGDSLSQMPPFWFHGLYRRN